MAETEFMKASVIIGAKLAPLKRGLAAARTMVGTAIKGMTAMASRMFGVINDLLKKIYSIGKKAFLALAAAVTASLYVYTKFEKALANVNTMLDKVTKQILPLYSKRLKEMAMAFGEATGVLAQGLYNILSAGIGASKSLDVLRVSMKAAVAGITETSIAAYAITGVMNAYGYAAEAAGKVSDIFFAVVQRGQTTFGELAPAIGKVTSIAAPAGVALEEVGAALATITKGGISTHEAVTYLRAAIISLMGKEEGAVKLAKQHGIELSVQGLKTKGLMGMVRDLAKLDAETLKNIFKETEARIALVTLIDKQTELLETYGIVMKSVGATQEAFAKQANTLAFQFNRIKQHFVAIGLALGEAFAPVVRRAQNDLIGLLRNIYDFTSKSKYVIIEWGLKIYNRVKAAWLMIVDLWKSGELVNSIKYSLELVTAQFELWGRRLATIMPAIGDLVAFEFSRAFGEHIGKTLVDMAGAVGKFSTLILRPVTKALYMAGRAVIAPGLYGRRPSLEPALAAAGRMRARGVPLPPGVREVVDDFQARVEQWDDANKIYLDLIRKQDKNAEEFGKSIADQRAITGAGAGAGAAAAPGARAGVGFVGLAEAWKQFAAGLTIRDPAKQTVNELKKLNATENELLKTTGKIESRISILGTVGA